MAVLLVTAAGDVHDVTQNPYLDLVTAVAGRLYGCAIHESGWGIWEIGNTSTGYSAPVDAWATTSGGGYDNTAEPFMIQSAGNRIMVIGGDKVWVVTLDPTTGDFVSDERYSYPSQDLIGQDGYAIQTSVDSGERPDFRVGAEFYTGDGEGDQNASVAMQDPPSVIASVDDLGEMIHRGGPVYGGYVFTEFPE